MKQYNLRINHNIFIHITIEMEFHSTAYIMNTTNNLHRVTGCSRKVPSAV